MDNEKRVDTLNTLIEINNDRIEGYETASKETDEEDLRSLFSGLIATSERCKEELTDEVEHLGGTPIAGTNITGKFFRAWMDVKVALTSKDYKAILDYCESGEEVVLAAYDKALKSDPKQLSLEQRGMIQTQRELLQTDYDSIIDRRDQLVERE